MKESHCEHPGGYSRQNAKKNATTLVALQKNYEKDKPKQRHNRARVIPQKVSQSSSPPAAALGAGFAAASCAGAALTTGFGAGFGVA